jgi:hypothetical protein
VQYNRVVLAVSAVAFRVLFVGKTTGPLRQVCGVMTPARGVHNPISSVDIERALRRNGQLSCLMRDGSDSIIDTYRSIFVTGAYCSFQETNDWEDPSVNDNGIVG